MINTRLSFKHIYPKIHISPPLGSYRLSKDSRDCGWNARKVSWVSSAKLNLQHIVLWVTLGNPSRAWSIGAAPDKAAPWWLGGCRRSPLLLHWQSGMNTLLTPFSSCCLHKGLCMWNNLLEVQIDFHLLLVLMDSCYFIPDSCIEWYSRYIQVRCVRFWYHIPAPGAVWETVCLCVCVCLVLRSAVYVCRYCCHAFPAFSPDLPDSVLPLNPNYPHVSLVFHCSRPPVLCI